MGVMKFRLPSNDPAQQAAGLSQGLRHRPGSDPGPGRGGASQRDDDLRPRHDRERPCSSSPGRSRATAPRSSARRRWPSGPSPYVLAVELARGKLNDVRNQLADWMQMGLRSTPELAARAGCSPAGVHPRRHVADEPEACLAAAREAAPPGLQRRRPADGGLHRPGLPEPAGRPPRGSRPTWAASWTASPRASPRPWTGRGRSTPCQVGVSWRQVAPAEGQYRWDLLRRPARLVPPQSPGDRGRAR